MFEEEQEKFYDEYARGVHAARKHKPENPSKRGTDILNRIWSRIRPGLVERGVVEVPTELPSDVAKWAVLPDWLQKFEEHPIKGRNVFEWLDSWVPKGGVSFRDGAMKLTREKGQHVARIKQNGQGQNDPRPAFTFHGDRLDLPAFKDALIKEQNRIVAEGLYPDNDVQKLDLESMEKWNSVMGGRCGTYVFAESSILFTGMTPHQETGAPIPWDVFWGAWKTQVEAQFPEAVSSPPLKPKHLFNGIGYSLGVRIQNRDGAAGYPYTNMNLDQIRDATNRPKFSGRPTKGTMFPHAFRHLVKWIEGGMPMEGELYDHVAQPATLTFRGDRAVDYNLRVLGTRGPTAKFHDDADQLAALMPGRSVIIVPTILVLAQSTWAQPLGDYIANKASPGFDWVDPAHSSERLDTIRRLDLGQAGSNPWATVGADASGWDRDVTSQMHAGEAAWYCKMFPKQVRLLYVDSELPIDVDDSWIAGLLGQLQDGEEMTTEVTQMVSDGSTRVGPVNVRPVTFDYHEFICKVMTMVNDAPLAWGDYKVDAPGVEYDLGGADPSFKDLSIVSNGGRRSGDAATGIGNSWSNLVVTQSYCDMSQEPRFSKLVARRAALQGEGNGGPIKLIDNFTRGDDAVVVIEMLKGGYLPSEAVAAGMCSVGLRANAKKQEASDIPGKPVFGFANVIVTENYMGKLMGRTMQRFVVQESAGLDPLALEIVLDELNDLEIEAGLMTTTATAKSRLAPMAGFPLLDQHPGAKRAVELAVNHDKYRLVYISDESFTDDGQVTEEGREMLARAKEVEAKVQARLRARRENVSVDLEALKEVYEDATVHALIEEVALDDQYSANPEFMLEDTSQTEIFRDLVSQA